MSNRDILIKIIEEVLCLQDLTTLPDSTKLIELGADEIDMIEIGLFLGEETGVNIPYTFYNMEPSRVMKLSIRDILELLEDGKPPNNKA